MPLRPAIPFVDTALDGTVIPEEYKGDFAHARRIADAAPHGTRGRKDNAAIADAVLVRGIVHFAG